MPCDELFGKGICTCELFHSRKGREDIKAIPEQEQSQGAGRIQMWSALFVCAIILNLCICSVGQILSSGTPLYVEKMGGNHLFSGLLVSVYIGSSMIGRIVSGRMTDNRSRRFVMLVGSCLLIVGSFLPVYIPLEIMLFVSKVMQGLGFATTQTAISAFAADSLPLKRMGEGIGYFGLGHAVAMALGPALSVWLISLEYSEALSVGIGCIGMTILAISFFLRYEKNPLLLPQKASYRVAWERKKTLLEKDVDDVSTTPIQTYENREEDTSTSADAAHDSVPRARSGRLLKVFDRYFERSARYGAIPALFFSATAAVFVSYTVAFALDSNYANPSLFFLLAALTAIVLRLIVSKVMDTFNPVKLYAAATCAGILSLAGMMLIHHEIAYYLCGFGYGFCIGISIPLMNAISVKASPQERYGAANGLFFFSYDIGFGLGVIGWGLIIDLLGYPAIFFGGIVCLTIALLLAARLFPKVP